MEPIAIVGMACRLPGAPSLEEFWNLLRDGRDAIDLIPQSRWDRERTFDPDIENPGKINTRHGGFIEGIDLFDNDFFRISDEEAIQMDPQQRIMLELVYEAFADAGLSPTEVEGTEAGVFVGVMSNDYLRHQTAEEYRLMNRYTGAGSGYCMIANRISYQFNLRGPSMAIDSACSSSLISTFTACQSLWTHQCSLALAGGVNLILSPTLSVFYTRGGLSAADARCRTLSSDASGMGRGEGAGIVILKRLSDAVRDDDNIYALIRGGAANHNGRGNGMSAPNRWAQQLLLRKAYEHAGVKTHDLDYVELHGTGTLIGDAIEATALGSVLAEDQLRDHPCRVGSTKTNLGHLEGAAGVAGLIKLALCLSHGKLVPSLWYAGPNPHVAFDTLPLKVQERLQDWPNQGRPRLAGISSFGLGGANAHLVLQSAPDLAPTVDASVRLEDFVLQLSAKSETALIEMAGRYRSLIQTMNDEQFSAFCRTSLVRPQGHDHRVTFVARSRSEMVHHLSGFASNVSSPNIFTGRYCELPKRKRVFIFPDITRAGFHAVADLAKIHPCIQQTLAECDQALQEVLLRPIVFRLAALCERTIIHERRALPLIHFGVQVALARLWQKAGLEPDAVAGAGMGMLASWVLAGAVDIRGAIARIADGNGFELTPAGLSYLAQSRPFVTDCYSSLGKNITSDIAPAVLETFTDLPATPQWKAVDYLVQSLDGGQAHFTARNYTAEPVIAALDAQSFWMALAQLSVRHNVQWKNFLPHSMLMRPPRYPWQHSRFWLKNEQAPKTQAAQLETLDGLQPRSSDGLAGATLMDRALNPSGPAGTQPIKAPGATSDAPASRCPEAPIASSLNREKLLNLPESERRSVLASYLKKKVAETLHRSDDDMDEPQTFTGLGIDSLTALQLKNRVEADLKMPVSLMKLLDGHSIGDLATDLLSEGLESETFAPENKLPESDGVRSDAPDHGLTADISELPLEELDRMLHELLSGQAAHRVNTITLNQ
ncbi:MAG TPA: beta-ketoacyl synthase N-terminal-like domain-containing protein [Candidatus Angelobacter sp.]